MSTVDTNTIAKILDLTPRSVQSKVKEGMPRVARNQFEMIPCIHWELKYWRGRAEGRESGEYRGTSGSKEIAAQRGRLFEHQADMAELDKMVRMKDVGLIEDFKQALFEIFGIVANELDSFAGRHANELININDIATFRQRLKDELRGVRNTISDKVDQYAVNWTDNTGDTGSTKTTEKKNTRPVGRRVPKTTKG